MARVVHNSLWDVLCAGQQHRKELVESWVHHTLQAVSIDMSFAPPLIVVQAYNLAN